MTDRNDITTTIIHGNPKNIQRERIVSNPNTTLKQSHTSNKMNASALEQKIDSGDMTLHPLIDHDLSHNIQTARNAMKTNDKTLTQKDLATKANQFGAKGIVAKDISDMESGTFRLTTDNKIKLQAVKKALGIK